MKKARTKIIQLTHMMISNAYVKLKDTAKMGSAFWMRTDKQHVYAMKDMSQIDWSLFVTMSMSVKMDQQGTIFHYKL